MESKWRGSWKKNMFSADAHRLTGFNRDARQCSSEVGLIREYAYATNSWSNLVSVVDTVTRTAVALIPVGRGPVDVAFTPDRSRAYVAKFSLKYRGGHRTLSHLPYGIGFTAGGGLAFVAVNDSSDVAVIETATRTIAARVPVLGSPQYVSAR